MKKILFILTLTTLMFANNIPQVVKDNTCMECHNIKGANLAPGFIGTAKKNINFYDAKAGIYIMKSIKEGSKGKYRRFSDSEMPPYSHLNDKELKEISDWILNNYENRWKF